MSFNTFLLRRFASKIRFSSDVLSIRLRNRVLSNIYANIVLFFIAVVYGSFLSIFVDDPNPFQIVMIVCPPIALSFYFLRQGNIDKSYFVTVLYLFTANYVGTGYGRDCTAAMNGFMILLSLFFFIAPSHRAFAMTGAICLLLYLYYIHKIKQLFSVNLSKEQSEQINILIGSGLISFFSVSSSFYFQKQMETDLWQMAQVNYVKSETLTKEVLEASRAKDVFLSSLSHEIRNPLNSVKGSVDYLLETISNDNHLKILRNAKLGCEVLINLVNNVLDAAKLKSDKMEVSFSETNFMDIVQKVLIINCEALRSKAIRTKLFVESCLPDIIWADSSRLLQITMNLISNAIKFTPQDGQIRIDVLWIPSGIEKSTLLERATGFEEPNNVHHLNNENLLQLESHTEDECSIEEIKRKQRNINLLEAFKIHTLQGLNNIVHPFSPSEPWSIRRTQLHQNLDPSPLPKGYLKVQVSDTGCGIAPQNIPKLFSMFTQAHRSVSTMHGGTGLGLWICKQLCQKMQGDIKLYSEPDVGTTIVFYIAVDNSQIIEAPLRPIRSRPQEGINVLVVDDYAHNRDLHKLLVEKEGARAILASSGEEAVAKFKSREEEFFSFIMMDVLMPGIDGFTAAKMIREWEREQNRKKVDIYFVTGEYFNDEETMAAFKSVHRMSEASGIGCLRKPVDVVDIRRTILKYGAQ